MAKKSTTIGEFIITIDDNNSVSVSRIYRSTMEALRQIAKMKGLEVNTSWNTQQFGKVLLDNFCGGKKTGTIGEYTIERESTGRINVLQTYKNTIDALRQCSESCGFEFDPKWNTQTFGNKLVTAAENGELGEVDKQKPKANNKDAIVDNSGEKQEACPQTTGEEDTLSQLTQKMKDLFKQKGLTFFGYEDDYTELCDNKEYTDTEGDIFEYFDCLEPIALSEHGDYGYYYKILNVKLCDDELKFTVFSEYSTYDGADMEDKYKVDLDGLINGFWNDLPNSDDLYSLEGAIQSIVEMLERLDPSVDPIENDY